MTDPERARAQLEEFLHASQFKYRPPRYVPRPVFTATKAWSRLAGRCGDYLFERGVDTSAHSHDLSHFHPDRVWYEASGWSYLPRILRRREVSRDDVFVDFGSGKGRVVLQAARYRFGRVIGVEISPELTEIARANVEVPDRKRRCGGIELVTGDATAYRIPDAMSVAYFYYPFVGDTFRRVIDNIVASHRTAPRRIRLIYAVPTMEEYVLETGLFARTRTAHIVDMGVPHRLTMYEAPGLPH